MKKKICIIDYNSGNQKSLYNLIDYLGYDVCLSRREQDINNSTHLLLPGVGSYIDLMDRIKYFNLNDLINENVLIKKKPFLGICVGMQVLSTFGNENNRTKGLDYIEGEVRKINSVGLKIPHIGWNNITLKKNSFLESETFFNLDFYFLHSYVFDPKDKNNVIGFTEYGETFSSIINKENIWGFQFHPEKSQQAGQIILKKFFDF
jgi:glutamine amidotransferase